MPVPITNDPISVSRLPRSSAFAAGMTGMNESTETPQPMVLFDDCAGGGVKALTLNWRAMPETPIESGAAMVIALPGVVIPFQPLNADADAALRVGNHGIALGRPRRRDGDVDRRPAPPRRSASTAGTARCAKRPGWEGPAASRQVEVLPAEHVEGLARQDVDISACEGPGTRGGSGTSGCRSTRSRRFRDGPGWPRRDVRNRPAGCRRSRPCNTADRRHAADGGRIEQEAEARVAHRELRSPRRPLVGVVARDQRLADDLVVAAGRVGDVVGLDDAEERERPRLLSGAEQHPQRRAGEPGRRPRAARLAAGISVTGEQLPAPPRATRSQAAAATAAGRAAAWRVGGTGGAGARWRQRRASGGDRGAAPAAAGVSSVVWARAGPAARASEREGGEEQICIGPDVTDSFICGASEALIALDAGRSTLWVV